MTCYDQKETMPISRRFRTMEKRRPWPSFGMTRTAMIVRGIWRYDAHGPITALRYPQNREEKTVAINRYDTEDGMQHRRDDPAPSTRRGQEDRTSHWRWRDSHWTWRGHYENSHWTWRDMTTAMPFRCEEDKMNRCKRIETPVKRRSQAVNSERRNDNNDYSLW